MSITKKLTIAVVALSLVLTCVVGSTLAFLIAESEEVTNTFTYGDIKIELWENPLGADGNFDTNNKDYDGLEYLKVVPGDEVKKNPTVTVKKDSESCYVFIMVTNNMVLDGKTIATYTPTNTWTLVGTNGTTSLYRYNSIIPYSENDTDTMPVFDKVIFDKGLTVENIGKLAADTNAKITIKAYAHQADNTDEATATTAAILWAGVTAVSAD